MSQTITIDDIWRLFQETNRLFQESQQSQKESQQASQQESQREREQSRREWEQSRREWEQSRREWEQSIREWDRRFQESKRKSDYDLEETRRFLRESSAETDRKFQETDRKFQETDRKFQETDRVVKEVSRQIGQLGGRWGEFVEGLVAPACIDMFTKRGIPVDEVFPRVKKTIGDQRVEIDLLVANTVAAILVEVKSNLKVEDVRTHLERLEKFKSFFPRYADCTVYGAVAGIVIDAEADRFAMNKGL
ncbi:MAG TPA: DUF3782 domain-containing protein, partial [Magnetococcales bacterium]|nr:DUF3782 domain-containing protein [Magnetococcales bacterium]